jgi:hypothetical protein
MKTFRTFTLSAIALVLFTMLGNALHAQQQERKDKIESMHTAYLTEKINLTPDQAKKFWPVYDQYRSDLDELQKQRKQNAQTIKNAGGIDNMSDADVQKLVTNEIDIKARELDLHKQYVVKFQEVISLKQVAKLFMAEEQFKLYLLQQLKARRQGYRGQSEFVPQ